jgi:hypothetical protein
MTIITGAIMEELATTSISLYDKNTVKSVVCVGCTGYADSILYVSEKDGCASLDQLGWCVHTCCSSTVLKVVLEQEQHSYLFVSFIASQLRNNQSVTVIRETPAFVKYLVFANEDSAYDNDVPGFSVCIVRAAKKRRFITCRDVRCKKGKNKRMENIIKAAQVCCHLQVLLKHLQFDLANDDCEISDDSFGSDTEGMSRNTDKCIVIAPNSDLSKKRTIMCQSVC